MSHHFARRITITSQNFCYWLQGFFELQGPLEGLSEGQVEIIKNHLNMVFYHEIDPSFPENEQDSLKKIHNGIGTSLHDNPLYFT